MNRRFRNKRKKRTWPRKFADAFLGIRQSVYRQSSYRAHFAAALLVVVAAWQLGNFDTVRWCLLVFCIAAVIVAEMFNTAVETLAKAVTDSYNPFVGRALDIASGAVLMTGFGAAAVGTILFLESVWKRIML